MLARMNKTLGAAGVTREVLSARESNRINRLMNAIVDVSCPKCGGSMELLTVSIPPREARMWKCAACAGMWLDRRACELLVGGELADASRDFIRSAAPGNATLRSREGYREAASASREGQCPDCREPLASYVTDEKTHGTRVALDVCRDHGTYFDQGEARTLLTAVEMKRLTVSVEDEANRASAS